MKRLPDFPGYDGHFITPRLAVGACPQPGQVPELVAAGIQGIVNVIGCCGTSGMAYAAHLPSSIHWMHLGFWDGWLMPEVSGYRETLNDPAFFRL